MHWVVSVLDALIVVFQGQHCGVMMAWEQRNGEADDHFLVTSPCSSTCHYPSEVQPSDLEVGTSMCKVDLVRDLTTDFLFYSQLIKGKTQLVVNDVTVFVLNE